MPTPTTLCLTGTTGNIGGAVLRAILTHNLIPPSQLVISTSSSPSDPRLARYAALGISIRQASFDDSVSLEAAYAGCDALFLVSTPKIEMDFDDAPVGMGREHQHIAAIDAARKAGVKHVYYTSLAFASQSKAGVMQAHERTEAYLEKVKEDISYTSLREGLYAESWPLYLGQYDVANETRKELIVAGDGPVSWTAIEDQGLGTALILADDPAVWRNKIVYLSALRSATLADVAEVVSKVKGHDVSVKVVSRPEYERLCIEDRSMDPGFVKWWSGSYDALRDGECNVKDTTLQDLLRRKSREFTPWEVIVEKMVKGETTYSSSEGSRS